MLHEYDIMEFIETQISLFHKARLDSLYNLKIKPLLKRKNPYLYKAKNILFANDFVKSLLDAHLSSQEEAIFGDFLERLAIFINGKVYGGSKSSAEGIDLEFYKEGVRYIVSIKSGPNWGNSSQIKKLKSDFERAKRILRTSGCTDEVIAVNGCCYGQCKRADQNSYYKFCGQKFWEFISGNSELYINIIKPLGYKAKEKNEEFCKQYAALINTLLEEFLPEFCCDGCIDWEKIVLFNSRL